MKSTRWFEVGRAGRRIAGLFQHGALEVALMLTPSQVGDDVGQRGLAEPGRTEEISR